MIFRQMYRVAIGAGCRSKNDTVAVLEVAKGCMQHNIRQHLELDVELDELELVKKVV